MAEGLRKNEGAGVGLELEEMAYAAMAVSKRLEKETIPIVHNFSILLSLIVDSMERSARLNKMMFRGSVIGKIRKDLSQVLP